MIILCILIFPFVVLAELMKMNNRGGRRRWEDLYIGFEENGESRRSDVGNVAWPARITRSVVEKGILKFFCLKNWFIWKNKNFRWLKTFFQIIIHSWYNEFWELLSFWERNRDEHIIQWVMEETYW